MDDMGFKVSAVPADDLFRFPEEIGKLGSTAKVGAALLRAMRPMGMVYFTVTSFPRKDRPTASRFLISNVDSGWIDRYFADRYYEDDPRQRAVSVMGEPVSFQQIRDGKAGFVPTEGQIRMLDGLCQAGRSHGLVVPAFGPQGDRGIIYLSGPGPDPAPRARTVLQFLSLHTYTRMRTLFPLEAAPAEAPLTAREVQVLTLARRGFNDREVARSVAISARTVRFHFENARRKLRASSRAEAIATAINLHLLPS